MIVYDLVPFQPGIAARRSSGADRARDDRTRRTARGPTALHLARDTQRPRCAVSASCERKASVVPLAADERFGHAARAGRPRGRSGRNTSSTSEFVLCTGTLEPRKNLLRVLEAHAGLARGASSSCSSARAAGSSSRSSKRRAGGRRPRARPESPTRISRALYQACTVFCYPSLYEGFGLPLLEAMAAGAACVTSSCLEPSRGRRRRSGLRRPDETSSRSGRRSTACSPPRRSARRLGDRAKQRAAEFSWDRTAAGTLAALEELIGGYNRKALRGGSRRPGRSPSRQRRRSASRWRLTPRARISPRILVFTKTAGFRHASIPVAVRAVRELGQRNGLTIDATEDARAFTQLQSLGATGRSSSSSPPATS